MNDDTVMLGRFIKILNENGFDLSLDSLDDELQYDSLQFVSTMVALEEGFQIQVPDNYLLAEGLDTGRDILEMVFQQININNLPG